MNLVNLKEILESEIEAVNKELKNRVVGSFEDRRLLFATIKDLTQSLVNINIILDRLGAIADAKKEYDQYNDRFSKED